MPEIEVNIEIYCARCNAGLCSNATVTKRRQQPCFDVEPCERCLEKEATDAYRSGHKDGYGEAKEEFKDAH